MRPPTFATTNRQYGAAAVEFALVAMVFFTIIFGILEFGRYFYVSNTLQEVTRRAAREQVVKWVTAVNSVQRTAVFSSGGGDPVALPAGAEVSSAEVKISFHDTLTDALNANSNGIPLGPLGTDPQVNVDNCLELAVNANCIRYVRATIEAGRNQPINYVPTVPLFAFLNIPLPRATVIMPAEAMGLR